MGPGGAVLAFDGSVGFRDPKAVGATDVIVAGGGGLVDVEHVVVALQRVRTLVGVMALNW